MQNIHRMKSQRHRTENRKPRVQPTISHARGAEPAAVQPGDMDLDATLALDGASIPRGSSSLTRTLRFSRVVFGLFLILHGIAHSRAGSVLADPARSWTRFNGTELGTIMVWTTQMLWAVSVLGFIAAGLGLLGASGLRRHSMQLVFFAAAASGLLLLLAQKPYAMWGASIDVALLGLIVVSEVGRRRGEWIWHQTLLERFSSPVRVRTGNRRILGTLGNIAAWTFLVYVALLGALRPWHRTWGATDAELAMQLPGDGIAPYVAATHAVTIEAPVSAVWPWLVQIGQDRGGFYSYTWIESYLLGAGIHNADRIHPEWQNLREGDFVRSARQDWLGGRFADRTGWMVVQVEPERSLTLLGWGTFALRPIDSTTTRFVIRTRAGHGGFLSAPLDFLLLEPGHFLMERRMMLGIKERAETAVDLAAHRGG